LHLNTSGQHQTEGSPMREQKLLMVNGNTFLVDAPTVSLALSHSTDRVFGILDIGNFEVCWMVSAGSLSLQEVPE
jgi:hypothetical protein